MVQKQKQRPESQERSPILKVTYGDRLFPKYLTSIPHVPLSLWYRGELRESDSVAVAVVGSRKATDEGKRRAHRLAGELAQAGVTVVSGLARGIDGAAHRGALAAAGRTLAVLGTGLHHVYPEEHGELLSAVIDSGAALSQFPPGFTGYRSGRNFLQRNHVLVGMSQLLVVVEAGEKSGSTAAIRAAIGYGRPVGLLRSLVDSQKWASDLVESGLAFVVGCTEDIIKRVEL